MLSRFTNQQLRPRSAGTRSGGIWLRRRDNVAELPPHFRTPLWRGRERERRGSGIIAVTTALDQNGHSVLGGTSSGSAVTVGPPLVLNWSRSGPVFGWCCDAPRAYEGSGPNRQNQDHSAYQRPGNDKNGQSRVQELLRIVKKRLGTRYLGGTVSKAAQDIR